MISDTYDNFWNNAISETLVRGKLRISKVTNGKEIPSPESSGIFRKSIGELKGQIADWRASIGGSDRGVHVVEFTDHYEMHVDQYDPGKNPLKHLMFDSPKYGFALGAITIGIGALMAYFRKNK
ncbi:MAG: hypothetical protein ACYDAO_07990 [Thermoplasmataceae archaeon]